MDKPALGVAPGEGGCGIAVARCGFGVGAGIGDFVLDGDICVAVARLSPMRVGIGLAGPAVDVCGGAVAAVFGLPVGVSGASLVGGILAGVVACISGVLVTRSLSALGVALALGLGILVAVGLGGWV